MALPAQYLHGITVPEAVLEFETDVTSRMILQQIFPTRTTHAALLGMPKWHMHRDDV